jgi:hypothetical protein
LVKPGEIDDLVAQLRRRENDGSRAAIRWRLRQLVLTRAG